VQEEQGISTIRRVPLAEPLSLAQALQIIAEAMQAIVVQDYQSCKAAATLRR